MIFTRSMGDGKAKNLYPAGHSEICNERRAKGVCERCGQEPRSPASKLGPGCHARDAMKNRALRAKQIRDAKLRQAVIEQKRRQQCREVVINGVTFVVVNSVVTESAETGRIRQAPHPFLR